MRAIDRLVDAGMDVETAFDTVFWYTQQDNEAGLDRYIAEFEHNQRVNPKDG